MSDENIQLVRNAAQQRILFSRHALIQMNRPERMISTDEVRDVILNGEIIEDYPTDPRGHSMLIFGSAEINRPLHVVCSPKEDYLAIITAYLPDPDEWGDNFTKRVKK
jgi:hypothetical protein